MIRRRRGLPERLEYIGIMRCESFPGSGASPTPERTGWRLRGATPRCRRCNESARSRSHSCVRRAAPGFVVALPATLPPSYRPRSLRWGLVSRAHWLSTVGDNTVSLRHPSTSSSTPQLHAHPTSDCSPALPSGRQHARPTRVMIRFENLQNRYSRGRVISWSIRLLSIHFFRWIRSAMTSKDLQGSQYRNAMVVISKHRCRRAQHQRNCTDLNRIREYIRRISAKLPWKYSPHLAERRGKPVNEKRMPLHGR